MENVHTGSREQSLFVEMLNEKLGGLAKKRIRLKVRMTIFLSVQLTTAPIRIQTRTCPHRRSGGVLVGESGGRSKRQ